VSRCTISALVKVSPLPTGEHSGLLARVEVRGSGATSDPRPDDLFPAITERHTAPVAFDDTPVPETLVVQLDAAAQPTERDSSRSRRQSERPSRAWSATRIAPRCPIHGSVASSRTGCGQTSPQPPKAPGYAFGRSVLESIVGPMVVRTFDMGNGQAARDEDLSRESALLAVLATEYDVASWSTAGQAMQRILLTTTAAGLKASFLNQPIEVPSLRRQLAPTLGLPGHPQLLLRFGYGAGGGPTPRRPISDVLRADRPA
jgi:hypothetical protein